MINIRYEGDFFINHSLAIVNREICLELVKNPEINLSIKSNRENVLTEIELSRFKPLMDIVDKKQEKVDFTIRHQWPPNFSIPEQGKLILMQPWEFGSIPESWLEPFITIPDQIWAISNFNKNVYIKDGIPQEKVKTIHLGIRKELYQNDISPLNIKTNKKFKFLFNGGTIHRKGIDLLLKAYTQEFSTNEDVTLIIKDIGTKNIYLDNYFLEIEKEINNKNNPEIIYLNNNFSEHDILSLYKACDCYVHPYRGEGFGLPIIEAMASGLPVVVTGYGPALEFCNSQDNYLLDFDLIIPKEKICSDFKTINYPIYPEVKIEDLRKKMRFVFENIKLANIKSSKNKEYILNNFTWSNTANNIFNILSKNVLNPIFRENNVYYSDLYHKKGLKNYNNSDFEKAYIYFIVSSYLNKNSTENIYYLALTSYKLNLFKQSLDYLSKLISLGNRENKYYQLMAQCLTSLGDHRISNIIKNRFNSEK